jgi:hypothetical protein
MAATESIDTVQENSRGRLFLGLAGLATLVVVFVVGLLWALTA